LDDCRRVAAHVQWLTITDAVSPVLIIRPADLRMHGEENKFGQKVRRSTTRGK
jgi:hypothetical protein